MKTRRVAYVLMDPGIPAYGEKGSSLHVQEVIHCLVDRGYEVDLFTIREDISDGIKLPLAKVHFFSLPGGLDCEKREQECLALNAKLEAALAGESRYGLIYERYSLWSYSAMEFAREHKIPGVLEVNAPLIDEQRKYRQLVSDASAHASTQRVFSAASRLTVVSNELREYVAEFVEANEKITVVPNGINPSRFSENIIPTHPSDLFTVGFLGHLKPWQGIERLVRIFGQFHQQVPSSRLLILGKGPEKEKMKQVIRELGLRSHVVKAGAVSPRSVPGWLASMDVGIAPYPPMEAFYFSPLKAYEYMAAGLPVVGSDLGQLHELIGDEERGIRCSAADDDAFVDALVRLTDSGYRQAMGQRARRYVFEHCTWRAVVDRTLESLEPASVLS